MSSPLIQVFVSYSHSDAPLVAPVVALLRASRNAVFRDADSVSPGKKWRDEISAALDSASLVVVFWCDHASRSEEVAREFATAIQRGKDVLPLLLDATPLHPDLQAYQWIDFQDVVGASHSALPARLATSSPLRPALPAMESGCLSLLGASAAIALVFGILLPVHGALETILAILSAVAALFVIGIGLYLLRNAGAPRHPRPATRFNTDRVFDGGILRSPYETLAGMIEDEVVRRTTSSQL